MEKKTEEASVGAWFSYTAAMSYSSLGRTTLTSLVTSGAIPAARVGKRVLISRSGLDEYLRQHSYTEAEHE